MSETDREAFVRPELPEDPVVLVSVFPKYFFFRPSLLSLFLGSCVLLFTFHLWVSSRHVGHPSGPDGR